MERTVVKLWIDGRPVKLARPAEYVRVGRRWELRAPVDADEVVPLVRMALEADDGTRVYGRARVVPSLAGDELVARESVERPEIVEP